jgi:hypothetical protein
LGDGDEHFSNRGRLLGLFRVELETVQFGHAVDDGRHLGAELTVQPLRGDPGVLHGVVQQRRGDGDLVETQIGRYPRHGDGVRDVGFARAAKLTLVGVNGGNPSTANQVHVAVDVMLVKSRDEALNRAQQHGVGGGARSETNHKVSLPVG